MPRTGDRSRHRDDNVAVTGSHGGCSPNTTNNQNSTAAGSTGRRRENRVYRHSVRKAALAAAVVFVAGAAGTPALATEGYFQHGYSALQKAEGGAGVAAPEDPKTLAINPAGLVSVGDEVEVGISLFSPHRQYSVSPGPGFVAPGSVKSDWNYFAMPNVAYSHQIDDHSAWGLAMYGNGGMNTNYPVSAADNPNCAFMGGGNGVYCGGKAGVNLTQVFLTAGYAYRSGNLALGIAPVFALQLFDAKGLGAFSGLSSAPGDLTSGKIDTSAGGGVRLGAIWSVAPGFRLAVAGATPTWMSKFSKYKGLFADGGGVDIPANVTVGAAFDATPDLTLMLDYKHIFYSDVASIGDSSAVPKPFGANGGPGFGWSDVDVIALGARWQVAPAWTLRAGYAHNTNPVRPADVTLNILAPGVITDHITGGASVRVSDSSSFDLSGSYMPTHSVSGPEVTPAGPTGRTITLSMYEYDISLEWRYRL
ncbi:MAG: outer membrane protein transport protein [Alphaproteobacteria bacterium]|nr:outer membrane protein transport protein [Alphaproteobacteria bacterium]MDE2013978.1 outer membrane protein transport protein [Alphaproteobacteria bacterium]MDE2352183.1 outer membrane protein transport protein [Alphaproteobacteria bacterium]